jgi:peptide/nickel transport system permease protein
MRPHGTFVRSQQLEVRKSAARSRPDRFRRLHDARGALLVLGGVALLALLAPWVAPYDPQRILDPVGLRSQAPSWAHLMGTDPYGRDVLSRMLVGARVTLGTSCVAVIVATMIGTAVGVLSGYVGARTDRGLMRLVDVSLSVPRVLLLLTIIGVWGAPSPVALALVLGATSWMGLARLVRGEVIAMRRHERLLAARAIGVGHAQLLRYHVLPPLVPLLAISATAGFGQLLLLESGLSFLGLGVAPPAASWGSILLDVSDVVGAGRWLAVGPGLVLIVVVIAVHQFGDALAGQGAAIRYRNVL